MIKAHNKLSVQFIFINDCKCNSTGVTVTALFILKISAISYIIRFVILNFNSET